MDQETPTVHWHAMDTEEVFKRLDAGKDGLSEARAKQRLEETGPNSLEALLRLLARQVHNPLIYLLTGAAVLSLLVGHRVDAAVIAGVIVLNSLLGFIQEWRVEGALNALREMAAPHARALRDGKSVEIDASRVAPGDVLVLETGDRAPPTPACSPAIIYSWMSRP
jgi:Ca2+-transporting ATPase